MAAAEDRWRMVRLAIDAVPGLSASRVEFDRRGASYTVDTLDQLRAQHPDWALYLLIGADNITQLSGWHDPEGILARCTVVAGTRSTAEDPALAAFGERILRLATPAFEVSSTQVRQRVREQLSIRYLVPEAVERYIRTHALYA
jgi:nicotinate-nucleotide adenylyltransferase